jgi:hypothetical protein
MFRSPSRRANNNSRGARRRRLQGCVFEKRQDKLAPCAPALFIGPSAQLGILRCPPACPHPQHIPSSGSMDNARVDQVVNPPIWPLRSARRFQTIKIKKINRTVS